MTLSPEPSSPLLRCLGLGRSAGGQTILDSIDLEVAENELIVVTGPSGAGKTSLLRLIAGLDRPTAGTVEIGGREVSSPRRILAPALRGVGMVFEHPALWPHLSVEQHLSLVLKASPLRSAQRRERLDGLLENLHLAPLRKRFPAQLSAGERRRVALARSLVHTPRILLLDEPLAHLDVHLTGELAALLIDLHSRERLTTICVMHRPEEVNPAANRYVIIENGRISQVGREEEVFGHPRTNFTAALARILRPR